MSGRTTKTMRKIRQEEMIADLSTRAAKAERFMSRASEGIRRLAKKVAELRAEYGTARFEPDLTRANTIRHNLTIFEQALALVVQFDRGSPEFEKVIEAGT